MSGVKAPSQRQLRAGELIRHALAEVFMRGETNDPDIDRIGVSVFEVTMSPDLRLATAYVRPYTDEQGAALLEALERNRKYVRGLITPRLAMKFMPDLRFRLDNAADHASKIDKLLADPAVVRDLKQES